MNSIPVFANRKKAKIHESVIAYADSGLGVMEIANTIAYEDQEVDEVFFEDFGTGNGMTCYVTWKKVEPNLNQIRLPCENCGELHIDEGEWATKEHHTHSCQHCGLTWRPAKFPTIGVRFIPGFKNV